MKRMCEVVRLYEGSGKKIVFFFFKPYIMNKTTYLGYIFLGNETIENYFFI